MVLFRTTAGKIFAICFPFVFAIVAYLLVGKNWVGDDDGGDKGKKLDADRLARADKFGTALSAVRKEVGDKREGVVIQIRYGEIQFIVRESGEDVTGYTSDGGKSLALSTPELSGATVEEAAFPLSAVTADTPERIVAAIKKRNGGSRFKVATADLRLQFGKIQWSFSGVGGVFYANIDGSEVKDSGEAFSSGDRAPRPAGPSPEVERTRKLGRCLRRAKGDLDKIQACADKYQ